MSFTTPYLYFKVKLRKAVSVLILLSHQCQDMVGQNHRIEWVRYLYPIREHTWIDFSNLIQWSNLLNHISAKFYVSNLLSLKV